jgi:geranylgeranyl pyrophosphate synthase
MDDDDLRRGRPTLHRKFDEATAVLAGDALLALAFEILADETTHPEAAVRAELVLALARAIGQDGLAGGQMMDLYPPAKPSAQDMFDCESRKTGALIRFAVEAGSMLGACSAEERARLLRFAENLGLLGLDGAARQAIQLEDACHQALDLFGAKAMPLRDLTRFAASRMH